MKKTSDLIIETKTTEIVGKHFPTRRTFLKYSGAAALTAFTFSAANSAYGRNSDLSDEIVGALNFALTVEFLQDDFYGAALSKDGLIPIQTRDVFEQIGKDQTAHVKLLRSFLGSRAVAKSDFDFTAGGAFGDVFNDYPTFLAVAQVFEDTGARACKGLTDNLQSRAEILTPVPQIHSVEARHAAAVRRIRADESSFAGESDDTCAACEPLTAEQFLEITNLFIKN